MEKLFHDYAAMVIQRRWKKGRKPFIGEVMPSSIRRKKVKAPLTAEWHSFYICRILEDDYSWPAYGRFTIVGNDVYCKPYISLPHKFEAESIFGAHGRRKGWKPDDYCVLLSVN